MDVSEVGKLLSQSSNGTSYCWCVRRSIVPEPVEAEADAADDNRVVWGAGDEAAEDAWAPVLDLSF